jgi:hypothetical protein
MKDAPWMHTRPQWAHPNATQIPARPWRYLLVNGRKVRYYGDRVEVRRNGRTRWKPACKALVAAVGEVAP